MANPAAQARVKMQANWPGATVQGRGKNWIRHQHPNESGRFALDTHIGPIHYGASEDQEIETDWEGGEIPDQPWLWKMVRNDFNVYAMPGNDEFDAGQIIRYVVPDEAEEITFQPQQLQWSNDLDQIEAIADPATVAGVVIDDELIWDNAYGPGIHFTWQSQTARMQKRIEIDALATIGPPQQFIIDGGNAYLKVPFIFQKTAGLEIWIDGVLWDEQTGNSQSTASTVEFRKAGKTLFYMTRPWASSSDEIDRVDGSYHYRKTGPNLFVEVRIPWTWLQAASYPIEIDPTIDKEITAGADDTYGDDSGYFVTTTARFLRCGVNSGNDTYRQAFRFTGISGLSGVTITTASIKLYGDGGTDDWLTAFYGDDQQAPAAPTTNGELFGITLTTAKYDWDGTGSLPSEYAERTITDIIQELADDYDPSAIQIVWDDDGTTQDSSLNVAQVSHYERGSSFEPQLHIEYTEGGAQVFFPIRR